MWKSHFSLILQGKIQQKSCIFLGKRLRKTFALSVQNFFLSSLFCRVAGQWYDMYVVVEKFCGVFHRFAYPSLTDLISSSISKEKDWEDMIFFSTVSIEEMMVVWLRLRILPMPGKDMSVI